ncbi:MAG: hypothetical protein ACXIUV_08110 [Alkalilacustris sp.]
MGPSRCVALDAGPDAPTLVCGRVHELCGPDRRSLALMLAGAARGPVLWIAPENAGERLHAPGASSFLDPGRLLLVAYRSAVEALWSVEESLRGLALAGAGGVVVAELAAPPGLTPVRRLHLAAGGSTGKARDGLPLGLLLLPEDGGTAGVESRWHLSTRPQDAQRQGGGAWTLERRRARGAGPAAWHIDGDGLGALWLQRIALRP